MTEVPNSATTPGRKGFYGWYALGGTMLVTLVSIGAFLISFGVFLPIMCEDLGWSRASLSLGITLGQACNGLPSPLWGYLVARYKPRAIMIAGTILLATGLAGMSLVQELWHVYIFYGVAGAGAGLSGIVPTSTLANNWFNKKRSLALSLIISSGCLGGFIFPPLTTAVTTAFGWRWAWLGLSAIVLLLATFVGSIILARNKPEDMGQVPDGKPLSSLAQQTDEAEYLQSIGKSSDWRLKDVLRTPTFWLMGGYVICYAIALGTINTHQVSYMQDIGYSPMVAATTLSVVSGAAICGSLGFGTLALKYNIRYLASAGFILQMAAMVILLTTRNLPLIYLYTILFGISNGVLLASLPTFIGTYYGQKCYPLVVGTISPFQVLAQAGAASVAGYIYDVNGDYTLAFATVTGMSLVGLICAFSAKPPQPQLRQG
jgi:sugar phosphate permease